VTGAARIPGRGLLADAPEISFRFDGQTYRGRQGESLAAALIANGVRVIGRSFKYHRPRGIYGIGPEDPSALVTLRRPSGSEPNTRATQIALYDGLRAEGQNAWPSVRRDLGALVDLMGPLFPAGFYYKTFMWPKGAWPFYERHIRRMAGLGPPPDRASRETATATHAHCEVLVAGGGAAGLAAALAAGRAGARVILADDNPWFGLGLLGEAGTVDGVPASDWRRHAVAELEAMDNVTLLPRTTVLGRYEQGFVTLCQTVRDAPAAKDDPTPRWRLWKLRTRHVVMATGAFERPQVFGNNDRPGVMTASAAAGYLLRYGVLAGREIVVGTDNDSGHRAASLLAEAGARVAIADARTGSDHAADGLRTWWNAHIAETRGRGGVTRALIRRGRSDYWASCDLVATSGGWSPAVHLYAHGGGRPVWDEGRAMFLPGAPEDGLTLAGAANGTFDLGPAIAEGFAAGASAAGGDPGTAPAVEAPPAGTVSAPGGTPEPRGKKAFVDIQNDVTVADLRLAVQEGYRSIEHVKRYTTLGMGTDQGKLGNVNGVRAVAEARDEPVGATGTTRFRPPYVPVPIAAVSAHHGPEHTHPIRRTAAHALHERDNCVWLQAGPWLRPQFYRRPGETDLDAVNREVTMVREAAGIVDVTTLGKIELAGPECVEFLNRVYTNGWSTLKVGQGRYGLMLREDGMVFDDGVTMRLDDQHFVMSTTSGNYHGVVEHLTRLMETRWTDLQVAMIPVTEQWFGAALAGPKARDILGRIADFDVSREAFPFMGVRTGAIAGIPARVFRISFSGELGYEINVPADRGAELWQALLDAGAPDGMAPYGLESMGVLRLEKGHFVLGRDADGRTTPQDIGLGRMVSTKKWFVGKEALGLAAMNDPRRRQLVGIRPVDPAQKVPYSSMLTDPQDPDRVGGAQGWIASLAYSPTLGHFIGLALVEGGFARMGERLLAYAPIAGRRALVEICSPHFYDPEGVRQSG